jgi:lipoate-protein ligase A
MQGLVHLGLSARADRQYAAAEAGGAKGPVCFETPSNYEITVGLGDQPRKLLGSAQVRKRGVVLQHGALPLTGDIARICEVLTFDTEAERETARQRVRQRAATVAEALGRGVTWDDAAAALGRGFAAALNLELVETALTERENELAENLRLEKYATEAWNARL